MKASQRLHVSLLILLSLMSVSSFRQPTKSFNRVISNKSTCQSNTNYNKQIQMKSIIEKINDRNNMNKNINKHYDLSNKELSSIPSKYLSLSIQLFTAITLSNILPAYALSASPPEEAVQLLYGYQTNIPSAITWFVMLYGAYKIYFGIFRWLASM